MSSDSPKSSENLVTTRNRGHEICIWMVQPSSGRVRKLRIKLWVVLGLVFAGALAFSGVGVLASDYARLQLLRAKNYLFLKSITSERDHFKTRTLRLQDELVQWKDEAGRVSTYQENVRQRLDELSSVIGSLKSMGALGPNKAQAQLTAPGAKASFTEEGVGGAEVECERGDLHCSSLKLEDEGSAVGSIAAAVYNPFQSLSTIALGIFSPKRDEDRSGLRDLSGEELLNVLDDYISTVRSVPFSAPGLGHISSDFGYRRSPFSSKWMLHEGMDFSLPQGSEIASTADGIVKEVRWNPTYGLVIDIEHNPTLTTRYAHLRKAFVSEGEHVCRGDTIALVGSTGRSTGPHLHYEVRVNGAPRNPERFIELGEKLSSIL